MTFAEFLILIAVVVLLYRLFRPFQQRLEHKILKFLKSKTKANEKPIINVTDYKKKE